MADTLRICTTEYVQGIAIQEGRPFQFHLEINSTNPMPYEEQKRVETLVHKALQDAGYKTQSECII